MINSVVQQELFQLASSLAQWNDKICPKSFSHFVSIAQLFLKFVLKIPIL